MREDLKAEEINKVFSFAMLKAFIASSITHSFCGSVLAPT